MHKVTNTSKETKTFWADDEQGTRRLYRVEPGKSVTANIDPNQPKFAAKGDFSVTKSPADAATVEEPAPKPKA